MKNNRCLLILGSVASLLLAGALVLVLLTGDSPDYPRPADPALPVVSPDTRLPENWGQLNRAQKFDLNYHRCLRRSEISPEHGRCLIDSNHGNRPAEAEYIYISYSGAQAGFPLPQITYLYLAVPDSATDEQADIVFENWVDYHRFDEGILDAEALGFNRDDPLEYALKAGELTVFVMVVYNYSDVEFCDDCFHGWDSTAEPRAVYASGSGGVGYEYLGNEAFAAGRDGADLADNCIALDLRFLILSQSSPDQLRAYFSNDNQFRVALDGYLGIGGGYDLRFPEEVWQKRRSGDVNYDILIKLYRADAKEYYLNLHEAEYDETYRHPDLPSIAINGCR